MAIRPARRAAESNPVMIPFFHDRPAGRKQDVGTAHGELGEYIAAEKSPVALAVFPLRYAGVSDLHNQRN